METDSIPRGEVEAMFKTVEVEVSGLKTEIGHLRSEVTSGQSQIIKRLDVTNGQLGEVKADQHRLEGGLDVLRWMLGFMATGLGAGAALAGVILTVILSS